MFVLVQATTTATTFRLDIEARDSTGVPLSWPEFSLLVVVVALQPQVTNFLHLGAAVHLNWGDVLKMIGSRGITAHSAQ